MSIVLLFIVLHADWTVDAARIGYFDTMAQCQKFAAAREVSVQAAMPQTPIRMVCVRERR
jgi:hypothetical protein